MSERYARRIRRKHRRLIRRAVAVVKAQVGYMTFMQRVKLAANIVLKKRFGTEKELQT